MRNLILLLTVNLLIVDRNWCLPTAASIPQLMQYAAASGLYQSASGVSSVQAQPSSAQSSPAQSSPAQSSPAQSSQAQANGNGNASTNGTVAGAGPAGLGVPPVFGMPIPASFMWSFPFPGQGIYLLFF